MILKVEGSGLRLKEGIELTLPLSLSLKVLASLVAGNVRGSYTYRPLTVSYIGAQKTLSSEIFMPKGGTL
jgi:hypothetical protein